MEHISQIHTNNKNPNLTIVLPGPCQAACAFCNWEQNDNVKKFLKNLKKLMKHLPKNFTQISISGGEPTISPVFKESLEIISKAKKKGKIKKVVLTTNGIKLLDFVSNLNGVVDHVNISRHHFDNDENISIFKTSKLPDTNLLVSITSALNKNGIDVNFNCVFTENTKNTSLGFVSEFIGFAKYVGVSSIAFRNQYDDYELSNNQKDVEKHYKAKTEQSCPVCFTKIFLIDGMSIKYHHSSFEPTEEQSFKETNETYELILNSNGVLSKDWEGNKVVSMKTKDSEEEIFKKVSKTIAKSKNPDAAEVILRAIALDQYSSCGVMYSSCGAPSRTIKREYGGCGGGSYGSCG